MPPSKPSPDDIAECVQNAFNALPSKFKPRSLPDGSTEWVTLAGIVVSRRASSHDDLGQPSISIGRSFTAQSSSDSKTSSPLIDAQATSARQTIWPAQKQGEVSDLICPAFATGVKCLPQDKVELANGNILHDSHAEVLAIRAFNRWLVDECVSMAKAGVGSSHPWLQWRTGTTSNHTSITTEEQGSRDPTPSEGSNDPVPFELRDDVELHMYISESPCGDASMELVMAEQADPSPWSSPLPSAEDGRSDSLPGRSHFDRLGIVRRKPARPDAPMTLSKSCSDKLARKQCTSLLSSLTCRLVRPTPSAYPSTLVLPANQLVRTACDRAFGPGGRMKPIVTDDIQTNWQRFDYAWRSFVVHSTEKEFSYSRRSCISKQTLSAASKLIPSNLAMLATPTHRECLINGVRQGRKQFDRSGASCTSRREMWLAVLEVVKLMDSRTLTEIVDGRHSYQLVKRHEDREIVKEDLARVALTGWKKGRGDDDWSLSESEELTEPGELARLK